MGKLVNISLRDIPLEQRIAAVEKLQRDAKSEDAQLLLAAAVLPSDKSYLVEEDAARAVTSSSERSTA